MPLNDVKFNVLQGGLGRIAPGEDHVSAIMFAIAAPAAYTGGQKCKAYNDISQAETDGILEGNATYGEVWYHASEFWRIAPGSTLFICFSATYAEMNTESGGKVRQVGAFFTNFSDVTSVHQAGAVSLDALHAPCVVVAGYSAATALNLSTVADLGTYTAPQVAVLLAGDGDGKGAALATAMTKVYIPAVGAALGAVAKARVHECIGWVQEFNLSDGSELEVIRLADGTNNPSAATLSMLNDKRYLVLRKHVGISGSYMNDSHTAVNATNDYAAIESSRTIQKAKRVIRVALLPQLNSPLTVDDEGKIAPATIAYFEGLVSRPLDAMQGAGEFSAYGVFINPDQNVLATSTLTIQVKIVPRGVARNIIVNIGFSVTTSF